MDTDFWIQIAYPQRMNKSFTVPDHENTYLEAYNEISKWTFMGNPWPVLFITAVYLVFVLKIGPSFMENRPPFNITNLVALYDLSQAIMNGYFVSTIFRTKGVFSYLFNHICHPMEPLINPYWPVYNYIGWYFLISKIGDLLDTVFFVLRKKMSHVTFLHVYHHTIVVLTCWFFLKYRQGEQGILFAWLNAFIHTIMYTYYFLATLGPNIRKYLWWKKYLTKLQILQFQVGLLTGVLVFLAGCNIPSIVYYYSVFNGFITLLLFRNFYNKSYGRNNKQN